MSPTPLTSANPPSAHQGWVCRTYIWRGRGQRLSLSCQPGEHCSGTDCTSTSPRPPAPHDSAWPGRPPGSVPTLPCPRRLAPSAAAPQPLRCSSSTPGPLHGCALCQNTLPPQKSARLPPPLSQPTMYIWAPACPHLCLSPSAVSCQRTQGHCPLGGAVGAGLELLVPRAPQGSGCHHPHLPDRGTEVTHMEKRLSPRGEAGTQATWYSRAAWHGKQTALFPPPVAWRVGAAGQGRPHADKRPSPLARVFCGRFQPGRGRVPRPPGLCWETLAEVRL